MDNFRLKFIEEATDLINALENSLLSLEINNQNSDLINEIFRIMHSLKGGGAMFGFETISEFTHNMENIYDEIRNKKAKITQELLSITLSSVDHLRNLLDDNLASTPEVISNNKILSERLIKEINKTDKSQKFDEKTEPQNEKDSLSEIKKGETYYIFFKPNAEIFANGTNPLFLVDELNSIGKTLIFARTHEIPELDNFDPTRCYTYWEIFLQTESGLNAIEDVFMFVEDDSMTEITKIGDGTFLNDIKFTSMIEELNIADDSHFDAAQIKVFAESLSTVVDKNTNDLSVKDKINKFTKEAVISGIRVASEKIDQYMNLVSELVTTQAAFKLVSEKSGNAELIELAENFEHISNQLRDNVLSMSLIPIENTVVRFKRLVRDLSVEFNKNIIFITEGTETEIDKTLAQALTDPLMHILRNSIDHGIETIEERMKLGKPAQGKIIFKAYYSGSRVFIEVEDDGQGIDTDKVRKKAIEKGFIDSATQLTEKEALNIIFLPGFSTADKVTDISGRGVGMDVLKRKIADIRGEIEISSPRGKGTKIIIKLPLTLSILEGLLVIINDTPYIIPLSSIYRIVEQKIDDLKKSYNNIVAINGIQYPFYLLREELEMPGDYPEEVQFIIVKYEHTHIGLVFDKIEGEYQVVLKPLGKMYRNHEIISGASILGNGTIALILDTNKVIDKFSNKAFV